MPDLIQRAAEHAAYLRRLADSVKRGDFTTIKAIDGPRLRTMAADVLNLASIAEHHHPAKAKGWPGIKPEALPQRPKPIGSPDASPTPRRRPAPDVAVSVYHTGPRPHSGGIMPTMEEYQHREPSAPTPGSFAVANGRVHRIGEQDVQPSGIAFLAARYMRVRNSAGRRLAAIRQSLGGRAHG